jgi:pimeloyl-ACP methyl ester carboxylesterase
MGRSSSRDFGLSVIFEYRHSMVRSFKTCPDRSGLASPASAVSRRVSLSSTEHVSDADAAFMRDSQVPIDMAVFETKIKSAAWRTKPSWAVIATEDKAFDQAMLIHMAERIKADITRVSASHAVFMTQPKVVADTIDRAAKQSVAMSKQTS